jgi:ribonuclease HI
MQNITVHTDGGARGNPGPSGIGVAFYDEAGAAMSELAEFIGNATNNVAEYTAIVRALEHLATFVPDTKAVHLTVKLDSELVQRQMNGVYKVKDATLKTYFDKAKTLTNDYASVTFIHIPRSSNKVADKLANEAMDKGA